MVTSKRARHIYEFGPFQLDASEQRLLCHGKSVPLTPKALATLLVLVENSPRLVEKEELLRQLWPDTFVEETTLARNISDLRKALAVDSSGGRYIETVPKRGYRFTAGVRELRREDGEAPVIRAAPAGLAIEEEAMAGAAPEAVAVASVSSPASSPVPGAASATAPAMAAPAPEPSPRPRARGIGWWFHAARMAVLPAAVLLVVLLATVAIYLVNRSRHPVAAFQKIAISKIVSLPGNTRAVISRDGRYVAYQVDGGARRGLWVNYLPTASSVQVVSSAHIAGGLTFSPEGDYIFYLAQEGEELTRTLYKVPTLGGPAVEIRRGVDSPITFSPDGSRFAFVREDKNAAESVLMIASPDGADERRLAARNLPDFFDYPAWSPDGRVIACTLTGFEDGFHTNVVAIQVESGAQKNIGTTDWGFLYRLAWLGDGSGLVVSAKTIAGSGGQIWQLTYPGGGVRRITNDLNSYLGVSASADASEVVTAQENRFSSLWVMPDRVTEHARQVLPQTGKYSGVTWTPDGKIVYAYQSGEAYGLHIMAADGSDQKQLTSESDHSYDPNVSSDGRYIVFASDRPGGEGVWRINIDGSHPELLARAGGECSPQCSPDGKWVVYATAGDSQWSALWRVPLEGGTPEQISEDFALYPTLSPDGRWIACFYGDAQASTQARPHEIAVLPFAGGPPVKRFNLPEGIFRRAGLCWTADGSALTYVNTVDGVSNIWRQPLDGSLPQPLTDFKGEFISEFAWSKDGRHLVCSRGTLDYDVILISNLR